MLARTIVLLLLTVAFPAIAAEDFTAFESGHVRPLALSPDGTRLFAVNTPDDRLEIFDVGEAGLTHSGSVFVGLEPVALAARSASEVWVVNFLSDSISVVDVAAVPPRVTRTLLVGDEPRDLVFAGPELGLAFVTTAHRGQNSPIDPQPFTQGVGRADVWVFDSARLGDSPAGEPKAILTLFGDSPRGLAVSPDGHTVYAAIFLSGNRTTTVAEEAVCDGGAMASPCVVNVLGMPGGLPLPNSNNDGIPGPETGLVVKYNLETLMWEDEWGRNWNNAARFKLPDKDVFAIDAYADPPREIAAYAGVGTVLYNLAVNPVSGALYVSNTDARNEVRLEPRLRGDQHESRLSIIDGGTVLQRDLNKHLDCSRDVRRSASPCPPAGATGEAAAAPRATPPKEHSLALPSALAVSGDGSTVYVAGYGSGRIGIFSAEALRTDTFDPEEDDSIAVAGGGPSGLVLDEARGRLYAFTRFDNAVSSIDLATRRELQHLELFNPEPDFLRRGRRFLYDADYTSANGEAACGSCHVFGDFDGLAWDLGDPDAPVLINDLPLVNTHDRLDVKDFHPLKGPMTTQTLQGLVGHGPMHWRGDRNGSIDGGDPMDERAAFRQFNPSFVSLLGRDTPLADEEMEVFTDFILALTPPPNPYRNLDNSLTPEQQVGRDKFFQGGCPECHELDPAKNHFGTSRASAMNAVAPQFMKVPALRNLYKKIGRFFGILFQPLSDKEPFDDQIRGFGFQHDGSAGRTSDPADAFLIAFDSNLAPVVGQQVSLFTATAPSGPVMDRVRLLIERSAAGECELVVHGVLAGEERGWLRAADGTFEPDRGAAASLPEAELLALAAESPLSFTCVPKGSGHRVALDRDRDGALDGDERLAGTDPADPSSFPGASTETPTETPTETLTETPTETATEGMPLTPTLTPVEATSTPTPEVTATEGMPPTLTATLAPAEATSTATPKATAKRTAAICVGDCDVEGAVSESELRRGIALLFADDSGDACSLDRFDADQNGRVNAAEILEVLRRGVCD